VLAPPGKVSGAPRSPATQSAPLGQLADSDERDAHGVARQRARKRSGGRSRKRSLSRSGPRRSAGESTSGNDPPSTFADVDAQLGTAWGPHALPLSTQPARRRTSRFVPLARLTCNCPCSHVLAVKHRGVKSGHSDQSFLRSMLISIPLREPGGPLISDSGSRMGADLGRRLPLSRQERVQHRHGIVAGLSASTLSPS